MAGSTFKTNPIDLIELLEDCDRGKLQLPDFQRSWVWDEERIRSLIASISRSFPVGALMALDTGGERQVCDSEWSWGRAARPNKTLHPTSSPSLRSVGAAGERWR